MRTFRDMPKVTSPVRRYTSVCARSPAYGSRASTHAPTSLMLPGTQRLEGMGSQDCLVIPGVCRVMRVKKGFRNLGPRAKAATLLQNHFNRSHYEK